MSRNPDPANLERADTVEALRGRIAELEAANRDRGFCGGEGYYRDIFDAPREAVFVHDAETGEIVDVNRGVEEMYGYTRGEVLGSAAVALNQGEPPYSEKEAEEWVRRAVEEGPQMFEWRAKRKTGEVFWVEVVLQKATLGGKVRVLAVVRDVTDRVNLKDMIVQSEKMLSIGGLAAGMAHEINNPLAGILQNVQVIRNRVWEELPKNRQVAAECGVSLESIRAYLEARGVLTMIESVLESGHRASQIVENMLSFSRKSRDCFEPTDLAALLDRTVALASSEYDLKKNLDFRRIEIVRDYDRETPKPPCEEGRMQQVFLNLLRNAAQAMADDPRFKVEPASGRTETPRIVLRVVPDGGAARVDIADNGPGMDETTRKRIFEPFFTTRGRGPGTGLGLYVSYFIVTDFHGGQLTVDSAPGRGSRFTVRLPAERSAP